MIKNIVKIPKECMYNSSNYMFVPKCEICNDIGYVTFKKSKEGTQFIPCVCKGRYSYVDITRPKEKKRKIIINSLIKFMKPKHIKFGSREEFYDNISSFIEYPNSFLTELAETFRDGRESVDEIKRLIGLLHIDNFALYIAKRDGIHPISGIKWNFTIEEKRYERLIKRNLNMIEYLEGVIKVLGTNSKSRYEDPNDSSFVG